METLIIQVESKHGRLADIYKCHGSRVNIGRGFVNDVVVTDPYVAARQIQIDKLSNNWELTVLDHTNPVLVNGKVILDKHPGLQSGDYITIGRMHLRVFSETTEIEETRKLVISNWLYQGQFKIIMPLLMIIMACAIWALTEYQRLVTRFKWGEYASDTLVLTFIILCWAGFWALIGRLLRHQHHFSSQVLFSAMCFSGFIILASIPEYIEYMSNNSLLGEISSWGVSLIGLSLLLKFNLYLATNLKYSTFTSLIVSICLLLFLYSLGEFDQEEFSTSPEFSQILKIPLVKVSHDQTLDDYMMEYDALFPMLEKTIVEK